MDNFSARLDGFDVISIPSVNSLDFVAEVFRCLETRQLFAVTKKARGLANQPGLNVTRSLDIGARHGWGHFRHVPEISDRPAQIVFTSGTEGQPKAVVLSARNLADVVTRLNSVMGLDDSVREYIGVPVTYSFGLGRARAVSAAGGAIYLPERFDPTEIRDMLEAGAINSISAVPSLWRIVLSNPQAIGTAGERVRWIEIGSQYMTREEKEAMKRLFPAARIIQHYGLTEASRSTFLDITASEGPTLESVGAVTGDVKLRISEGGAICIHGPHVASGIIDANGALQPVTDDGGWFTTNDKGELRDGVLWFLGRLDDQINLAGVKLAAEVVERDMGRLLGNQQGFAIVGVSDPLRGEVVLLVIESGAAERRDLFVAAAELVLKRHGVSQPGALRVTQVKILPLTETGKVQRRRLREIYESTPVADPQPKTTGPDVAAPLSEKEAAIADVWRSVVGAVPIRADNTFYDLGGDSLNAIQIGLAMDTRFSRDTVRATLEGRTLREVAAVSQGVASTENEGTDGSHLPDITVKTWAVNATRGLMVLTVLLSHWGPGLFARFGIEAQAEQTLGLVYRMGTPGFATVFGIGLGFFMLPDFEFRKRSIAKRLRNSFLLVFAGFLLVAGVTLVRHAILGDKIAALTVAGAFYNVLAFYLCALAASYILLGALARTSNPAAWALGTAIALWALSWPVSALLPASTIPNLLELPKLLLAGHYNILHLMPLVLAGISIGYLLSGLPPAQARQSLLASGAIGCAVILTVAIDLFGAGGIGPRLSPFFGSALGYLFYVFAVQLVLGLGLLGIPAFNRRGTLPKRILEALIVLGGLALPVFAFHGIVIPLKDVLRVLGAPAPLALALPLGCFLAFLLFGGRRLHRMYFS